jgi:hypothetical protein
VVRARASRGFDSVLLSSSVLPRRPYCNGTVPLHGPYISSSRTTRKRHKQTSGGSAGDARTS